MSTFSSSTATTFTNTNVSILSSSSTSSLSTHFPSSHLITLSPKPFPSSPFPYPLSISSTKPIKTALFCKPPESEENEVSPPSQEEDEDEWLQKLPEKNKPLYSHSLPCIEAWLKSLGFHQSQDDRAKWLVTNPDWHAQLSLDITDLYIRYLKSGPGNLEKDVERRFSYALSREDIENAVLGGP